jgi:hypothetical protein
MPGVRMWSTTCNQSPTFPCDWDYEWYFIRNSLLAVAYNKFRHVRREVRVWYDHEELALPDDIGGRRLYIREVSERCVKANAKWYVINLCVRMTLEQCDIQNVALHRTTNFARGYIKSLSEVTLSRGIARCGPSYTITFTTCVRRPQSGSFAFIRHTQEEPLLLSRSVSNDQPL